MGFRINEENLFVIGNEQEGGRRRETKGEAIGKCLSPRTEREKCSPDEIREPPAVVPEYWKLVQIHTKLSFNQLLLKSHSIKHRTYLAP